MTYELEMAPSFFRFHAGSISKVYHPCQGVHKIPGKRSWVMRLFMVKKNPENQLRELFFKMNHNDRKINSSNISWIVCTSMYHFAVCVYMTIDYITYFNKALYFLYFQSEFNFSYVIGYVSSIYICIRHCK